MNIEKEREALVAEIELFIAEAMKAYVVERWADSYQNTEPFAYTIDDKNEIWWMKTHAHQLWQFWKAAKAQKLEGCVVVPETLSLDLARKRAEYIYQGAKNYLAREYANLSAIEMQLFKERWIESKAVSLQTDYLLTLESARGGK
ncbi:hypothetical protein F909_03589 [Acinetobacter sp. ANC 3929]|uniref:hypothetical protein n=1 Tax=Acinetobacter sp. ANC 3929 TaxID=1217707 RepID=UPI0002CF3695|nr:hypothetical protein [Acinetobacter sp. ANC 3929]ENW78627.1 hypothetical protein F909_03589 [Acinetobacter sp. ANC 3929]